mmetsp:Transcript_13982/g.29483  ORF Transcript_13982/g.29483 Transcript_13982/m.29483 type:complete len:536 (+) Transcript_13982:470-2077(+)
MHGGPVLARLAKDESTSAQLLGNGGSLVQDTVVHLSGRGQNMRVQCRQRGMYREGVLASVGEGLVEADTRVRNAVRKNFLHGSKNLARWDLLRRKGVGITIHFAHGLVIQGYQNIVVHDSDIVFVAIVDHSTHGRSSTTAAVPLQEIATGIGPPLPNIDTNLKENGVQSHTNIVPQRRRNAFRVVALVDSDVEDKPPGGALSSGGGDLGPLQKGRGGNLDRFRGNLLAIVRNQDQVHHSEHGNGHAGILDHSQFLSGRAQKTLEAHQKAVLGPNRRPPRRTLVPVAEARQEARNGQSQRLRKDVGPSNRAHPRDVVQDVDRLEDPPPELLDLLVTGRNVVARSRLAGFGQVLTDALNQSRLRQLQLIGAVPSLGLEASESPANGLAADVGQDVPKTPGVIRGSTARDVVKGSPGVFGGTSRGAGSVVVGLPGAGGVHHVDVQRGNVAIERNPAHQSRHSRRGRAEIFGCPERVRRGIFFRLGKGLLIATGSLLECFASRLPQRQMLFHVLGSEEIPHGVELLVSNGRWWCLCRWG